MSKKIENQIIKTEISSGGYIEHNLAKKYAIIERFKYKDNNSLFEFSGHSHCIGKYKTLHSAIQAKHQFDNDENSRINKDRKKFSYWIAEIEYVLSNFHIQYKIIK